MIRAINNFLLIEPVAHETFVSSDKQTFDEVGILLSEDCPEIRPGSKVYFDSFMARKYPNPNKPNSFFWLIHKDEVCAIDE